MGEEGKPTKVAKMKIVWKVKWDDEPTAIFCVIIREIPSQSSIGHISLYWTDS